MRDNISDYDNPPEYQHPKGTVAESIGPSIRTTVITVGYSGFPSAGS